MKSHGLVCLKSRGRPSTPVDSRRAMDPTLAPPSLSKRLSLGARVLGPPWSEWTRVSCVDATVEHQGEAWTSDPHRLR